MIKVASNCSYVFMEFKTPEEASHALNAMDGHPFDSKHTFAINYFTDIERYSELDENFAEPEAETYQPKVRQQYHSLLSKAYL